MNKDEELIFYPKHPSGIKTHKIETSVMPILEQDSPFDVKTLYNEFVSDSDTFFGKYVDKRFEVTGIAKKIGPDIHNKPSIEISDSADGKTFALVIFPTNDHYSKVEVGDTVVVRANYLVMSNLFGTVMKYSELVSVKKNEVTKSAQEPIVLNYPIFDGKNITTNASVIIEDGIITKVTSSNTTNEDYLLMPCFIDAHTHINTMEQIEIMLNNGIAASCDVAAPDSLVEESKTFTIVSSAGMTMGTLSGKAYVQKAISSGAKYIKVLLMEPNLMLKNVLKDICNTAHDNGLKVATHAVSVKAVQMSVDCGVDILIHVPMKEKYPEELAKTIAEKGIVVIPTLVMMETFAHSGKNGYKLEHYDNAKNAVKLLYDNGVTILAGTDSNPGSFAPPVEYGTSMHRELELLTQAGMTPIDVLTSATSNIACVFGMDNFGTIKEGNKANLMLIKGRPDKNITDTTNIEHMWIDKKTIL